MGIERLSEFWPDWKANEIIGEGSYGRVYKAVKEEGGISSLSAIKVISIPMNQSELTTLYSEGMSVDDSKKYLWEIVSDVSREIKLMQDLKGASNVVIIEDFKILEKKDGVGWDIFIRMELLDPLDRVMINKRFDIKEIVKIGIDLCTAIEACEKMKIIHRDIKPANIFITAFGDYKLGDFGVAREMEKTSATMSSKGTFNYMAPEVAHGQRYDSTVDIYSIGLVLYNLLNKNHPPFIRGDASNISYNEKKEAVDRRLSGEVLPAPVDADKELAEIVLRACSYDRSNRYKTPTEFKNALKNYINPSIVNNNQAKENIVDIEATIAANLNKQRTVKSVQNVKLDITETAYRKARDLMVNAITVEDFDIAISALSQLAGYKDSDKLIASCQKKKIELINKNNYESQEWNIKYSELKIGRTKNRIVTLSVIAALIILLIYLLSSGNNTPTL